MKNPFFSTTSLAASVGVLFLLGACTASVTPGTGTGTDTTGFTTSVSMSASSSFMTVSDLVALLSTQGNTATLGTSRVQQPFFAGNGQEIKVNGETVQVYQYSDAASAQADANKIADNGMKIGSTAVNWAGPPHFFQKDNLLVLYVGTNQQMLNTLQSALGVQFAGTNTMTGTGSTTGTGATMGTGRSAASVNTSY